VFRYNKYNRCSKHYFAPIKLIEVWVKLTIWVYGDFTTLHRCWKPCLGEVYLLRSLDYFFYKKYVSPEQICNIFFILIITQNP
jgi:hypothetical protein